ncbi:CAP domain-containing protein [Arthrospira platensis SPKY1]|nr:CAP domain-containing protein [Arthrospira platensis SPKY1]
MTRHRPSVPERRYPSKKSARRSLRQQGISRRERYQPYNKKHSGNKHVVKWLFVGAFGLLALTAIIWLAFRDIISEIDEVAPVVLPATAPALVTETVAIIPTVTILETNTPFATPIGLQNPLPNVADLQQQMYRLVNDERASHGLSQLAWDTTAALAGQRHAEDMAQFNYFSHWNRDGLGPDHRYTQIGGKHAIMENLHAFNHIYNNGQSAPIENWQEVIQNAHTGLMNSPGHRANILDPAHTHVGIGMAYNPQTGQFRLAQEFTNQYVRLVVPLPLEANPGEEIVIQGNIEGSAINNALLDLAYEPFPLPMHIDDLNQSGTYQSAAASLETRRLDVVFNTSITLPDSAAPGLYHIRIFVDLPTGQAQVMNHVVTVQN